MSGELHGDCICCQYNQLNFLSHNDQNIKRLCLFIVAGTEELLYLIVQSSSKAPLKQRSRIVVAAKK